MIAFGLGGICGLIPSVRLQKRLRSIPVRMKGLEKYFDVAPYATRDSNTISGIYCSRCHRMYNIDEGTCHATVVCPWCGEVTSSFDNVHSHLSAVN